MSKKFWEKLIKETYTTNVADDMRLASRQFAHDVFFGEENIKNALIESYQANGYKHSTKNNKIFKRAAQLHVSAAKTFCNSKKKWCAVTPYSDGFVVTIFPRKGRKQAGIAAGATTFVDPTKTDPYKGAMRSGWNAATKHISSKLKINAKKGEIDFLHADDPSAATKGPNNKSPDATSYGVYDKKGNPDHSKIGGRKSTVGTYYADQMFGQGNMSQMADDKMSSLRSEEYEQGRRLSDLSPNSRAGKEATKRRDEAAQYTSIPKKTLDMFTQRAEKAILRELKTELGWKMTRSKGGAKGRRIEIVIDGSVGAASNQPKLYPWDMPIRAGDAKRGGIEDRLNDILQKEMVKMLRDVGSTAAADIRASETVGEILESDLATVTLDSIRKEFKTGKNVKVKVTRKTPKVKDRKSTKSKVTIKQNTRAKGRVTQKKTAKKAIPIAKATGKPDRRYKGAPGGRWPDHSPIALTQLLNKALPNELKKNMTGVYPRSLEWRTGRFGQSAEVTSIVPFPNLTQIQYTYMKNPYEVFETDSGNPMASPGRDPRTIIGGTIRELAQSIMGTKFGLVRTKRV